MYISKFHRGSAAIIMPSTAGWNKVTIQICVFTHKMQSIELETKAHEQNITLIELS